MTGVRTSPGPLAILASVGRLHITAIAALGVFTFGWVFLGRYPWVLAGVVALDWFIVNLLNRVVDQKEDRANQVTGADFAARNARALTIAGFSLLAISLVVVHLVVPAITLLRIAYHLLGLAYNWPLLPGRRRIKQLYFFKNTASAAGFLITIWGYIMASVIWGRYDGILADGITLNTIYWSAAFFLPFELSYEIIYDLRDAPGDEKAGVRSFPVVHGQAGAVAIIDTLLFVSMGILVMGYVLDFVPWRVFIMIAAPILQLVLYKKALKRGITSRDCVNLTWLGAGLLIVYHLWILADLPGAGM